MYDHWYLIGQKGEQGDSGTPGIKILIKAFIDNYLCSYVYIIGKDGKTGDPGPPGSDGTVYSFYCYFILNSIGQKGELGDLGPLGIKLLLIIISYI